MPGLRLRRVHKVHRRLCMAIAYPIVDGSCLPVSGSCQYPHACRIHPMFSSAASMRSSWSSVMRPLLDRMRLGVFGFLISCIGPVTRTRPAIAIGCRRPAGVRLPALRFIAAGADCLLAALGAGYQFVPRIEWVGCAENGGAISAPAATPVITRQPNWFTHIGNSRTRMSSAHSAGSPPLGSFKLSLRSDSSSPPR